MPSSFRGFESYLSNLSSLDENGIQLISKQYNSKFITHKNTPGDYTFKDLSEVLSGGYKNEFELRKLRPIINLIDPIQFSSTMITLL